MPFYGAYEEDLFRKIINGKYDWPDHIQDKKGKKVELSKSSKNLVRKILVAD